MKLKLTLMMIEVNSNQKPWSSEFFNILVDEDDNLPFKYMSTKTVPETLQEIYDKFSALDVNWAMPVIEDLRRIPDSLESEALYIVKIPKLEAWIKRGKLVTPRQLELEDFYERAIIRQPRSLHRS